jgi:anthranilate/para-aminobenzoate synthase component II
MILMIDNYDSFTYNLVQYMGELGAELEVYRNDEISLSEIEQRSPEKIVISPGPCTPSKAGISKEVIQHFAGKIPLLGVCLGHQSVVEAFGGEIIKAKKLLPNPFAATRYHSLVVNRANLPDCFEITAESDDGEIMGVRHKELAIEGVQFHPESILTVHGKDLLKNFIDLPAEKVKDHEGSGHPA